MPDIAFHTAHDNWPWLRQTPGGAGVWGDHRFHVGEGALSADWLVVYDDLRLPLETNIPREHRIVVISEPPGMRLYPAGYLDQFGVVLSPYPVSVPRGRNVVGQVGLPWFYGVGFGPDGPRRDALSLEDLRALPRPEKTGGLSVVCSRKSRLPKHRARLRFVEALQARLGDRVTVFGRGFAPVADKAEAILPFRYHLVLENNDLGHFWTEKLADAYLGWSFPIFSGCAAAADYFGPGALAPVDIADVPAAIEAIRARIERPVTEDEWAAIAAARTALMERYNVFAVLSGVAEGSLGARGERVVLQPGKTFGTKWGRKFALWRQRRAAARG